MPSNPNSERILVVNDEEAVRELVASMLTSAGYQYKPAADGLEALALLDSGEEFDLLLCNLMMPNLNGMELLERTKGRFPDMPFVLETGTHDISVCFAAIRNGAYDYILQPFVEKQFAGYRAPSIRVPPPEAGEPSLTGESRIAGRGAHRPVANRHGQSGALL